MPHLMRRTGFTIALAIGFFCVPTPAISQVRTAPGAAVAAAPTPEALAERYIAAMRQSDWNTVSGLMHPRALASIRSFITAVGAKEGSSQFLTQMFGASAEQLAKLSGQEMFARFL